MEFLYIGISITILLLLLKMINIIKNRKYMQITVFSYLVVVVLIALIHYRIFLNSELLGVVLEKSLLVDIASLVLFLLTCIVPATILKKKLNSNKY